MAVLDKKGRAFLGIAIIVLALAMPVACTDKTAEKKRAAQPDKLAICIGGAPGIPVLLAYEQGLFAREGLEVTLKRYRTGTEGFEDFFKGECDMAAISETSTVFKSFDHQDFSILANLSSSNNSGRILVNRKSNIKTPLDLKGKRIFVLIGSSNHYFLDMYLLNNGLTLKEVRLVDKKDVSDVSEAFKKRVIDAFCATDVNINKPMKQLGNDAVVFDSPDLCMAYFHLVARNSLIAVRPDIVRKTLTALVKSEELVRKNPKQAIKTAAGAMGMDEQDMTAIWAGYRWEISLPQSMLLSFEHEAKWFMTSGQTQKTEMPNYLDFVHTDALRALKPEAVTLIK